MYKIVLSFALLAWPLMSANALHLGKAVELLKKTNEEVVANIFEDRVAVQAASMIQKGEKVDTKVLEESKKYCADTLALIETSKLRKKALKRMMSRIDGEILNFVHARQDGFDEFEGRRLSARISRRLQSLLEFEAERYRDLLEVLNRNPS